jgi:hypothetical protein
MHTALRANAGNVYCEDAMKMLKVHTSEYAWVGSNVDVTIRNDGTTEELSNAVLDWLGLIDSKTEAEPSYWYKIFGRPLVDPSEDQPWLGLWF